LTTGILEVFRGSKPEPDTEIGQKGAFFKGLEAYLLLVEPLRGKVHRNRWTFYESVYSDFTKQPAFVYLLETNFSDRRTYEDKDFSQGHTSSLKQRTLQRRRNRVFSAR